MSFLQMLGETSPAELIIVFTEKKSIYFNLLKWL